VAGLWCMRRGSHNLGDRVARVEGVEAVFHSEHAVDDGEQLQGGRLGEGLLVGQGAVGQLALNGARPRRLPDVGRHGNYHLHHPQRKTPHVSASSLMLHCRQCVLGCEADEITQMNIIKVTMSYEET